jgi:glucose-6-phosphate isomerase
MDLEINMSFLREKEMTNTQFLSCKAYQKLKEIAEHPYDLTKEGNITPQRLNKYIAESAGYRLLYGTERINEETMHALGDLAHQTEALQKMTLLQAGEIVNFIHGHPSENRAALHTATRDFFENPSTSQSAEQAAQMAKKEVEKLKAFIAKIDEDNQMTDMLVVGIGGSELGPKAAYEALQYLARPGRHVHFIGNIDPDCLGLALKKVNLAKTLVLVISKTGTTLETVTNEEAIRAQFKQLGLNPSEHIVSITSEGSPLDNKSLYLECFHIWDWIGGRYSTSSMVGGVLLSFAYGFQVFWEFLRGANAMDKAALNKEINKNIPLLGALLGVWNRNFLHAATYAIIPYSQALGRFTAHIQQVDMESNGKHIDQEGHEVSFETGPIVFGEPGTNAQHSFFQSLHQGTTTVPIEFIGFKQNQSGYDFEWNGTSSQEKLLSNLFAQSIALATGQESGNPNQVFKGNRPSHILLCKQLTPFALGALMSYYEHKIAFQGFIWGINSFDQEGVTLGKHVANKLVDRFAAQNGHPSRGSQPYPVGDALLKQLETL